MAQNGFTSIGELAKLVVARSTLTHVTNDWRQLDNDDPDWVTIISLDQGLLSLVHVPSQTRSETTFDGKNIITAHDVFVTDRDNQRCEDGHWVRLHGLKAERVLRIAGHPNTS